MKKARVTNPANVLLIEDTLYNMEATKKAEMKIVLIEEPQDTSFKIAFDTLSELNKIHMVDVDLEEPLTEPKLESSDSDKDVSMGDDQEDYKYDAKYTEWQQNVPMLAEHLD